MSPLGELLGSATRGNIIEALALSDRPLTAYRVAMAYNMNIAKVYIEFRKLNRIGAVGLAREERGKEYVIVDEDLRRLALKLSSRVQTYRSWGSDESKRARFRMGIVQVPRFSLDGPPRTERKGRRRMPGELDNLAILGRKKFDSKYRRAGVREYDRL